jgi:hypothetical protein
MKTKQSLLFAVFLFSGLGGAVFAQERSRFDVAIGFEANANADWGRALGGNLYGAFGLFPNISLGVKAQFSHDFEKDGVKTFEAAAFARWYFWKPVSASFFIQADIGVSALQRSDNDPVARPLAGAEFGVRVPAGDFFVEPVFRAGYPFGWGLGVNIGYKISLRKSPSQAAQPTTDQATADKAAAGQATTDKAAVNQAQIDRTDEIYEIYETEEMYE